MNRGPILIVDDDTDDRELLQEAWKELAFENELIFFDTGDEILRYLKEEKRSPFLILCDVNIPRMSGFELKAKLLEDADMNSTSIPFVFWSSLATPAQIEKSYHLGGNGFFIKENSFEEVKQSLAGIVKYWQKSKVPNDI
ncbi:MAG: response regulator [Flavisolibacter sp.]|nr:response regulator [Flavisolibacter sp.]